MQRKPVILLLFSVVLLIVGLCIQRFIDRPTSSSDLARQVAVRLEKDMSAADAEAARLIRQPLQFGNWPNVKYSFFLIDGARIVSWSKNDFVPDWRTTLFPFSVKLLQTSSGDYLLKKWQLPNQCFLLLVITLQRNYGLVNNYLKPEWNEAIFKGQVGIFDLSRNKGSAVCLKQDGCVFSIQPTNDLQPSPFNQVVFLAFVLAIISLVLAVLIALWHLHREGQYQQTFFWLAAFLLAVRIALVELDFPNAVIKFAWFDPKQFASSSLNASMGDLFLNSLAVLALCIYLFIYLTRFSVFRRIKRTTGRKRWAGATLCILIAFFALLFPFLYGEVIYHNSVISLEITGSLVFEPIRVIAFCSLLIGCCCSFLVMHSAIRMALFLDRNQRLAFFTSLFFAALAFLGFFLITGRSYWITLQVGAVLFLLLYLFRLSVPLARLTFKSFLYFLLIIMAYALQGSLSIRHFQDEKKNQDLLRYGNKFLVDEDVLGEYLLNESTERIGKDPFIQLRLSSPFLSKTSVRQKIKLFYLPGYFDRYDVNIYLFNQKGEPLENSAIIDLPSSMREWQKEIHRTAYHGIYYINDRSPDAAKKYVAVVPVKRRVGILAGYAVLDLTLKKIIPQNVYPELLVDNRFSQYSANADVSYAWYSNGKLNGSFGSFNYEKEFNTALLKSPALLEKGTDERNFHHAGIKENNDRLVVITGERYPAFYTVTNFSFFFILGLSLLVGFLFVTGIIAIIERRRLNYSARIQLYVYLAFFFPLLSVSITTLSLISRSNKDRLIREYGEKARMIGERIASPLERYEHQAGSTQIEFQNELIELAKLSNADASIFSPDGTLLASSQPAIFENHLVSHLVNRKAWTAIVASNDNTFIDDEMIGTLKYSSSYAAIRSPETGMLLGILGMPFFSSAASLEQSRITVLANILTVFVVIFILFSFLSFFIAKGLTFPLRFITQSLQKTSLTETNQRIIWNSRDEIGLLANEYNKMVQNLEQSRAELVRSQKESTWREIARQVAHEIKNPLTPMKLTLQQWEKNLGAGDVDPGRSKRFIEILMTQLETLNDIAGSFSAFARMPAPVLTRVDVAAIVKRIVALHSTVSDGNVEFKEIDRSPVFVLGDEQLFGRIFSNLILNALQSANEDAPVKVSISIKEQDSVCVITVADNGSGIEAWVRDKVFLPHFSTKRTGSGLGLAIVRQGVEQSGGRIWFETGTKGTSFFIELPLADPV